MMRSFITVGLLYLACVNSALAHETGSPGSMIVVTGTSLGRKINDADKKLGSNYGVIKVVSPGRINETIRISPHHVLLFAAGTWEFTASPGVELESNTSLKGLGIGETTLKLLRNNGSLIISKDYDILHGKEDSLILHSSDSSHAVPDNKVSNVALGARHISISDIALSGGYKVGQPEGTANGITIYGFWFNISNVLVHNFSGNGILTEYVYSGETKGIDAAESFVNNVKVLGNGRNGWVVRGSHDSIVSGLISALNNGWGIDVQGKKNYYSGGGLMLTNVHAYGNTLGGVRTESGANILAFGLESEANYGPGVLLRSNDNIIHGEFYSNRTYGIQLGDNGSYAGANYIDGQLHNNGIAQIAFTKSAGFNYISGVIYASGHQKYFYGQVTKHDFVSAVTGGLNTTSMAQHLPGGVVFDSGGNIHGLNRLVNDLASTPIAQTASINATISVSQISPCLVDGKSKALVSWSVESKAVKRVKVFVTNPGADARRLFSTADRSGSAETGDWVRSGVRFDLVDAANGQYLATNTVPSSYCAH